MTVARTTATLIKNAVAAHKAAGLEVGAVEVMPGGRVRILVPEVVETVRQNAGGNSCDDLFGPDHE